MLTGLLRMMAWITVEVVSITHEITFDGRSMPFFPYVKQIGS
ncbi:hypothetical protein [Alkalihalobacillus sp. AL-G]|nr:hypothetical protein [Alkalihalobacillus sp. AL-G]